MSVRKCSSLNILTTKSNIESFSQKWSKSQTFCSSEVDSTTLFNRFSSLLINFLDSGMQMEASRDLSDFFSNKLQIFTAHTCATESSKTSEIYYTMISAVSPLCNIKGRFKTLSIGFADIWIVFFPNLLDMFFGGNTLLNKFLSINVVNWRSLRNILIHHRLSKSK